MSIVNTTEYKAYATITVTTWDTLIGELIDIAQGQIEDYCNREFGRLSNYIETIDGQDADGFVLENTPIHSITSVTITYPDGSTEVATDYTFDPRSGRVEFRNKARGVYATDDFDESALGVSDVFPRFPRGFQNIQVAYDGGYDAVPGGLKLGMYQYLDELFRPIQYGSSAEGQYQSERLGDYQYTRATADEAFEKFKHRFDRYRRIVA